MPKVENIKLLNFRNITSLNLSFGKGVNILVGENGQGKTNIIESIYLLTRGQSFRPGSSENFIRKIDGDIQNEANLTATFVRDQNQDEVQLNLISSKKNFLMNKKRVSSSLLAKTYANVLFSPESLSAIKDGPEQRRILVDDLLLSQGLNKSNLISEYKRCLRTRNKILKDSKQDLVGQEETESLLESLNPNFLRIATELTIARIEALKEIHKDLNLAMNRISGIQNVDISVDYLISDENSISRSRNEIFAALQERMNGLQNAELAVGTSLVGPHKHDVKFLFNGEDSRYYCSQGQQRALILSFKMGQIMYHYRVFGEFPILLLDDVLSELDDTKRSNLIRFLNEVDSQIFLTTTDFSSSDEFSERNISIFQVESGGIIENELR